MKLYANAADIKGQEFVCPAPVNPIVLQCIIHGAKEYK